MSLNKAMIIGRLGSDPEVRYTQSNVAVANFSVATSEKYKDKQGNQVENTEWHRAVAWGRTAEIIQEYLRKGSLVYIEGPIQTREWTNKDDQKRYTTEIKVLSMQMLDSKSENAGTYSKDGKLHDGPKNTAEVGENFDDMDDSLPF